jgi:hypothetical protein
MVALLKAAYRMRCPTWTAPDAVFVGAVPTPMGRLWTQGWVMNFHGRAISPVSNIS